MSKPQTEAGLRHYLDTNLRAVSEHRMISTQHLHKVVVLDKHKASLAGMCNSEPICKFTFCTVALLMSQCRADY